MKNDSLFSPTKVMDFCLLPEIRENIGKSIRKNLNSKYSRNFLIMLKNLLQVHLKVLQKEQFKKQLKQPVI